MTVTANGVAAIAAIAAAVFSLLTLVVAGFRDERKWRREATVDTLVKFLTASFNGAGRSAYLARLNAEDLTSLIAQNRAAHDSQTKALTRLRIIAPARVVAAAEELHEADHTVTDQVLYSDPLVDLPTWEVARSRRQDAREKLINSSRRTLGLRRGPAVGHSGLLAPGTNHPLIPPSGGP